MGLVPHKKRGLSPTKKVTPHEKGGMGLVPHKKRGLSPTKTGFCPHTKKVTPHEKGGMGVTPIRNITA